MSQRHLRRRSDLLTRIGIEVLEDRSVPATITLSAGTLTISNPRLVGSPATSKIEVIQSTSSDTSFQVKENGTAIATFSSVSNITINGSNNRDVIAVSFQAGRFLLGNLTVNGTNGNDDIRIEGNTTGGVRGNVNIDAGLGDDFVGVGGNDLDGNAGFGVNIRGNLQVIGNLGADQLFLGFTPDSSEVRGAATFYGFQFLQFNSATILGNMVIDSRITPSSSTVESGSVSVAFFNGSYGRLTLNTSIGNDVFTLASSATIKTTTFNGGFGDDRVDLLGTVNGNFTFNGGDGADTVNLSATTVLNGVSPAENGSLTLNMGDGANVYNTAANFTVNGNMTITGGNDDQSATIGTATGGTIGGVLAVKWGTGTNSLTLDNGASAGSIEYTIGGAGPNTVSLNNSDVFSNTFTFIVPAVPGTYNAILNFNPAGPGIPQNAVTLTGGTTSGAGATGSITINYNSNTHGALVNNLQGTIVVTENP